MAWSNTSTTGVQSLAALGSLTTTAFTMAPGGTGKLLTLQDVTQFATINISVYAFTSSMPVTGATATIPLNITWYDDLVSGIPVFQDEVDIWVANNVMASASALSGTAYITLPVRGQYLSITTSNPGTASTITMQFFSVYGSQNTTPRVYCKQIPPPSLAFFGSPTLAGNYYSELNGILGSATFNAAADTNYFMPMGLFTGQGNLYALTSAAFANDVSLFSMVPMANNVTLPESNPRFVIDDDLDEADDTDDVDAPVALPKCPTIVVFITGAASIVTNVCLTAMDQA